MPLKRFKLSRLIFALVLVVTFSMLLAGYRINMDSLYDIIVSSEKSELDSSRYLVEQILNKSVKSLEQKAVIASRNIALMTAYAKGGEGRAGRLRASLDSLREDSDVDTIMFIGMDGKVIDCSTKSGESMPAGYDARVMWGVYEALHGRVVSASSQHFDTWQIYTVTPLISKGRVVAVIYMGLVLDDKFVMRIAQDMKIDMVLAARGVVIARSHGGRTPDVDTKRIDGLFKEDNIEHYERNAGSMVHRLYSPLKISDEVYALVLENDISGNVALLKNRRSLLAYYFLVAFGVTVLFGFLMTWAILSPLKRLNEMCLEIRRNYGSRISNPRKATNEIELLDDTISMMVIEIEGKIEKLMLANEYLDKSNQLLKAFSAKMESVREEERHSISRRVHDELGQMLAIIKLDVSRLVSEGGHYLPTADFERLISSIDNTIAAAHSITAELRPPMLDHMGLVATIEWYAEKLFSKSDIHCEVVSEGSIPGSSSFVSTMLYRACQEALTNIARHSGARSATVSVRMDGGWIVIEISDDGRGITADNIHSPSSFGIIGIKERMNSIHGSASFGSAGARGTLVVLSAPVFVP